jgi:PAS domain S-box-containing protein
LQSLLNQLNVGVFRFTPDGQLLDSNSAFEHILRLNSPQEANRSEFNALFSGIETLAPGQKQERELQLCRTDGELIWVSVSQTLNITYAQTVIDALLDDITDRKRAEEMLKRLQEELLLQVVNLTSLLRQVLTSLEEQIQQQQATVTVEEPLFPVVGHYNTVMLVVTNLLTNAMKYVTPGVLPHIRVWSEQRQQQVRLWVEDNGIGIAPEYQERIFGVFERLHGEETYPGTGMGLAIVRKAIERMGGQVGVESQIGEGSRFWIELPLAESSNIAVNGNS